MIDKKPMPLKHTGLWLILFCCGILSAYICFVAVITLWIGFNHLNRDGFWMPILTGVLSICIILWFFFRISRFTYNRIKDKELINTYH